MKPIEGCHFCARTNRADGTVSAWQKPSDVPHKDVLTPSVNVTPHTGLFPGVTYHCIMSTASNNGTSLGFTRVNVTTLGAVPPDSPNNLPRSDGGSFEDNLGAVYINGSGPGNTGGSLLLHWNDSANNEAGFQIQRSLDDVNFTTIGTTATDVDQYTDGTVGPDSVYFYRVCAMGDSSGNYNSGYTVTQQINTPGVSIVVDSNQADPAGNPEIWVDTSAMNYSNGSINPPTTGDTSLVPVTVNVPLGADDYGTATLGWDASIRLYNSSGGQIGGTPYFNGYAEVYSYTWNVSPGTSSQTFSAQCIIGGSTLGASDFELSTALQLFSGAAVIADPLLPQATTAPSTTKPVSNLAVVPPDSVVAVVDPVNANQIHVSWHESSTAVTGFVVYRSVNGGAFTKIGTTANNVTKFKDLIQNLMPTQLPTGGYQIIYQIVAVQGRHRSVPSNSNQLSVAPIPFSDERTVRSVQILQGKFFPTLGGYDLVKVIWDCTIYDEFGNPMPNLPFSEKVTVTASRNVFTPPIVNAAAVTGVGGLYTDVSQQTFYNTFAYIKLKQQIIVGTRIAVFYTDIDDTGSTAGSSLRAIFH